MGTAPRRTRSARQRHTAKRSPKASLRYVLILGGLLVVCGIVVAVTGVHVGPRDLPTWEGHAETAQELNQELARLVSRSPTDPYSAEADAWLDEVQVVLDQFVEIGLTGAVGGGKGYNALKRELDRTREYLTQAMPGEEWAEIRAAALAHVPRWRVPR